MKVTSRKAVLLPDLALQGVDHKLVTVLLPVNRQGVDLALQAARLVRMVLTVQEVVDLDHHLAADRKDHAVHEADRKDHAADQTVHEADQIDLDLLLVVVVGDHLVVQWLTASETSWADLSVARKSKLDLCI